MTALFAQSQNDPVIFEINGKKIHKSEFMKEFLRSVGKDPQAAPTACTYEKRQALEEYVELFVNYRTKLEDAYARGLDTTPSLVKELKGYRDELAAPYLIDSVTLMKILREAYDRNHYTMHAAHILVKLKKNASPEDTLKAYNEAMQYYERAMAGEDFFKLSKEVNDLRYDKEGLAPDDPRRKDNGDLGNFTVFEMVYPFESAVYSLQPGEISKPVRTAYGYHVIKLVSKSPFFGKCTFQHIWCANNNRPSYAEGRIREAYGQLQDGQKFATVCMNYSDDHNTVHNGGLLSDMSARQLPPEYVVELSKLRPGEYSQPFETSYGWHILLLNSRDSIPSFDDMVPNYRQRLARDQRNAEPRNSFIAQSKVKYNFVDYTTMYEKPAKGKGKKQERRPMASLDECVAALTPEVFNLQWIFYDSLITDRRPLFAVGDSKYTAVDFLRYVEAHQHADRPQDMRNYVDRRYNEFIDHMVYDYADARLESENPEFGELIQEYRNGLMIFTYNDELVWSKAIRDTAGFEAFYRTASQTHSIDNEEDAPYFWNERAQVTLVTIDDSSFIAPSKVVKIMEKGKKKGWSQSQLYGKVSSAASDKASFRIEEQLVEKEHQNLLSSGWWRPGVYCKALPKGYQVIRVEKVLDPCLKSIKEARGYYINDYQSFLDASLLKELRAKYHVVIYRDVIDEITY